MQVNHFELPDLGLASPLISSYIGSTPKLRPFVAQLPNGFDWQARVQGRKNFDSHSRQVLVQAMRNRYEQEGIDLGQSPSGENLSRLAHENVYTVTTGHQLNLFTGPAYFIYKIINTIKLAEKLTNDLNDAQVVPVFWMASEDHDWEEVDHTHLYGSTLRSQAHVSGPVGRQATEDIDQLLETLRSTMRWEEGHPDLQVIERSVKNHKGTWSSLTFHLVHGLFATKGLLIIDADDPALKGLFSGIMRKELFERKAEQKVLESSEELEKVGGTAQVHPRSINLFYMTDDLRKRVVFENDRYYTSDHSQAWTEQEMEKLVVDEPESLSPNVVLRPVYQELILPNLAYIGGPGELAYWLQLKGVFELYQIPFPNLILRNHAVLLDAVAVKRMNKFDFTIPSLFNSQDDLIRAYVQQSAEVDLSEHLPTLTSIIEKVSASAAEIDPTLVKAVEASGQRMTNELLQIEKRLQKAVKQSEETAVNQIRKLHATVFPNQTLQERHQNYFALNQMSQGGLMEACFDAFDPLAMNMTVLSMGE